MLLFNAFIQCVYNFQCVYECQRFFNSCQCLLQDFCLPTTRTDNFIADPFVLPVLFFHTALHLFSMGRIEDLVQGRDIMTTVRKSDKNCLLFKQHDQRITFINKWMATSPCVLNLSLEFDPVHLVGFFLHECANYVLPKCVR